MSTPTPDPTKQQLVTPTASETAALRASSLDDEIRALAQQLQKQGALGFDPSTHVKGIVTAINYNSSPPTVSIQISGDTTTTIDGVRFINNYTPVINDVVDIRKQGPDLIITGQPAYTSGKVVTGGANGWVVATLTNGSHDGNDQGNVAYRLILDNGSWKMQWRGGWSVSGTYLIDTDDALASQYRPQSLRSLVVARQTSTGAVACHAEFLADGRVRLAGNTQSTLNASVSGDVYFTSINDFTSVAGSHSHLDGSGFSTTTDGAHDHSIGASHDHGFSGGSHSHPVTTPTWISLHGVEYFI